VRRGGPPQRAARLKADPAVEVLGPLGWEYQAGCPVWQIDLGDVFRKNFETVIPTLIAQGTWDVSTPMENALELVPFFKNSRLVLINGGSHNSLQDGMDASEAFRRAVMKFAATGDMSDLPKEVNLPPVEWVVPGKER
jgi:pimeloyl-ACP methyl ester carboxylesterase